MNKMVMMSLMVMITVLGLGKISLPFLQPQQVFTAVSTPLEIEKTSEVKTDAATVATKVDVESWAT
ncbi:MAG: hypothetical protein L3J61_03585, partial [Ghiorsea sp.]|nr:hypothetical protein [Ghiorsea sp.]